jgi:plastocyanin
VRVSSRFHLLAGLFAGACVLAPGVRAQSLLDRPDNVSSDWVGNTGTLYFNFIHRFSSSPPPERKVSNFPTFLIAAGLGSRALLGVNYATNSALVPRYPNEYELFARYKLWDQDDGRPLDVGGAVDYNVSVRGVDGELSLARRAGPLRVIVVGRVLADTLQGGPTRLAFGGGGTWRLLRYVALAGDAARMTGSGASVVWSAGVHIALPNTPHTLSIHASNANTATLQGLSRGGGVRRYGFEFTIPLTLSRFFHPDAAAPVAAKVAPAPAAEPAVASRPDSAHAHVTSLTDSARVAVDTVTRTEPVAPARDTTAMAPTTNAPRASLPRSEAPRPVRRQAPRTVNARINGLAYIPSRIDITAGTTVQWKNNDPLIHTVTATDGSFGSPQFGLDARYRHTFTTPGTYTYYCTLHPNMKATVVVK